MWSSPAGAQVADRLAEYAEQGITEIVYQPTGPKVVMWFAAGNRDEDVFGNPYDFDATRRDNDHVTFGEDSPHPCLGNPLARTGIRIMFEELIRVGRRGRPSSAPVPVHSPRGSWRHVRGSPE